jgi:hypothetical protein
VRAYVAAKPRGAHGAHRYGLSEMGLDAADLRERFAFYRERFDVPEESEA